MGLSEQSIEVATHGRYLVDTAGERKPMLVGFHGYAESADTQLDRLRSIAGSDRWIVLAIQGLHRFYRGGSTVVASWMTRQNREFAIADNAVYIAKVIDTVARECSADAKLVLAGFSQGVSMAFRAAATVGRPVSGVIALGGDVPPELESSALAQIPAVLLGRGTRDELYPAEKMLSDEQRLREAGVNVQVCTFDGGHEWTPEFGQAASRLLDSIYAQR